MLLGAIVGAARYPDKGPGLPPLISVASATPAVVAAQASSLIRGFLDKK